MVKGAFEKKSNNTNDSQNLDNLMQSDQNVKRNNNNSHFSSSESTSPIYKK